jgi:uncharacterized OB-fold protein
VTALNAPFWEAARAEELVLQQCTDCRKLRYPIAPVCPSCLGTEARWTPVSGRGEVFARALYRRAFGEKMREAVPYVVAIVQLKEGPRMISNIICPDPETVAVGDKVSVVFDVVTDKIGVPRFRLAQEEE